MIYTVFKYSYLHSFRTQHSDSVYMYINTYIYTHRYIYNGRESEKVYIYTHCVYMCRYIHMCVYIQIYTNIYTVYTYTHRYVYIYIYIVYKYIYTQRDIYTQIYIHRYMCIYTFSDSLPFQVMTRWYSFQLSRRKSSFQRGLTSCSTCRFITYLRTLLHQWTMSSLYL